MYLLKDETRNSQGHGEPNTRITTDVTTTTESPCCCRDGITLSSFQYRELPPKNDDCNKRR